MSASLSAPFTSCRQASALERGIANQLRGLSDGYSESIPSETARLERQLAAIRERLKTSDAMTVKLQMRDTRRFCGDAASESERTMGRRAADRARGNRKTRAKNHAQTDAAQLRCHGDLELARDTRTRGYYGGAGRRLAHNSHRIIPAIPFEIEIEIAA